MVTSDPFASATDSTTAEPAASESHVNEPLQRCVVLLGVSNLTRGIATVVSTSLSLLGPRLDILAATGHGRSYGATSWIPFRSLPGIVPCGLWDALKKRTPLPTTALVTDIGNDLLFQFPVPKIAEWVEQCLVRLTDIESRIVMTELPAGNLAGFSEGRFLFFRRLFTPGSRLQLHEVVERVAELNRRLAELARRYDVKLVAQRSEWYGLDPIHIRLRYRRQAWGEILSSWRPDLQTDHQSPRAFADPDGETPPGSRIIEGSALAWRLRLAVPQQRTLFGRRQQGTQPAVTLADGTQVSFY